MFKEKTEIKEIIEKSEEKINEIIEIARTNIVDYRMTEMSEKDFIKEWEKLEDLILTKFYLQPIVSIINSIYKEIQVKLKSKFG